MINLITSIINKNIFSLDLATQAYFCHRNSKTKKALKSLFAIDPIKDFDSFRKAVIDFKQTKTKAEWLGLNEIAGDSSLYGHLHALCQYANIQYRDHSRLLLPAIEHGISWIDKEMPSDSFPYTHCIVSQGPYRHSAIRKQAPSIPHYIIGPYIHYAKSYYSKEELTAIKKIWGKTLLVFPAHTYESSRNEYSQEQYVANLLKELSSHFDTIVVSSYWNDVDDPIISLFASYGAIIVSSGMREDFNFLPRLKSLIWLADATTGNVLGTNVGYSLYYNKPFLFFDGNSNVYFKDSTYTSQENDHISKEIKRINEYGAQLFNTLEPDKITQSHQMTFYERYWGGDSYILSPAEMKALFAISKKALNYTHGNISLFAKAYERILSETTSITEKRILQAAMS